MSNKSGAVRLHKYLADRGFGSRRACERLIEAGRVSVDGEAVREQGVCIDPSLQRVTVEGKSVGLAPKKVFILLNKPRNILCTSADPLGRQTFLELLPNVRERVFTVGRLDRDSEGLLLVTNDGQLAFDLSHPSREVEKVYLVWTNRRLTGAELAAARKGVEAGEETLKLEKIELVKKVEERFLYSVSLKEGKTRHIRRAFAAMGADVIRLKRVQLGALNLGSLNSGAWRYLKDDEVELLRNSCQSMRQGGAL